MSSLTTRTEQLAAEFAAVNDDVIATVTGCTAAQWRLPCVNEGRTVGVVAHHIATVHRDFTGLLTALVAGQTRSPGSSMEQVHASNARHARDFATVGQSETLDLLRTNGAAVTQLLGRLDDEQARPHRRSFRRERPERGAGGGVDRDRSRQGAPGEHPRDD